MKQIKVAAGILNQTPLDWNGNKMNIIDAISESKRQGVKILCLPEMCIPGYGCEDAFFSPYVHETSIQMLKEILPETKNIIVSLGLPIFFKNKLFNAACLVANGQIIGFVAKRFLAGNGIHYEPRWFTPWPQGIQDEITIDGEYYPIGDIHFNLGGIRIGFEICEDAWVANRPGIDLFKRAVDIILNPSASHFAFGKINVRKGFVMEASRAFGISYIYANLLGNESGRAIYDGGAIIASNGKLLASGKRFTFKNYEITSAIIDVDITRNAQVQSRALLFVDEDDKCEVRFPYEFAYQNPEENILNIEPWENSNHIKEEEFARAMVLGLFDYMRKSKSNGFVISLSGGADSSCVASLCYLMVKMGIAEIGKETFIKKISYVKSITGHDAEQDIIRKLITCVYQSTRNSGDTTLRSAKTLAEFLNAEFMVFDIDAMVEGYKNIVSAGIGRNLSWETDDVTLQNIQARVRAPGVWMITNIKNALLLATSNRSEAAVGYATMDGDTCGGLSPIAGIDKHFLRKWLKWLEENGINNELKVPGLDPVNNLEPTAELRPQDKKQTDEDDLMPYEVLDYIEKAAIRDKRSPVECLLLVVAKFPTYEKEKLRLWIIRFFSLWCRNQWKRERYAPSFHLDDENLDPKTWCRFPILSSGFEKELAEVKAFTF